MLLLSWNQNQKMQGTETKRQEQGSKNKQKRKTRRKKENNKRETEKEKLKREAKQKAREKQRETLKSKQTFLGGETGFFPSKSQERKEKTT